MRTLEDKVAIITGASSGVGWAAAELFAAHGAKIVVTARRKQHLEQLVARIRENGGEAIAVPGDIRDESHVELAVQTALQAFDGLDIAFNNAGILGAGKPLQEIDLAEWNNIVSTNLTSAFLCAKYQVPALLKRGAGSILFTGSFVGHTVGLPGMADYAATKSGLVGLTQVLAAELGPKGVRVNALLPGGIDTPMGRASANTPEALEFVKGLHGLKRIADPLEIAKAALFLCSDDASFVTGAAFLADGGVSITKV